MLMPMISYHLAELFGFFAGIGFIGMLLALATSIFWIWMIIDCATNAALDGTQKIVWLLVILFLHFIGALIYFIVGRGSPKGVV
jgi:Phospholipase_D-nuclease N-terminal